MSVHEHAASCCPVCSDNSAEATRIPSAIQSGPGMELDHRTHSDAAILFRCPSCGEFIVTECDEINLKSPRLRHEWMLARLSALLREHTIRSLPTVWLRWGMDPYGPLDWDRPFAPIDVDELLRRWPRTVNDKLDRALSNFGYSSPRGGHLVAVEDRDKAIAFAEDASERQFILRALIDQGMMESFGSVRTTVRLTPRGWGRFDDINRGKSSFESPVFVAMWFGSDGDARDTMDQVYREGIHSAVELAGFRCTRSDLVEHNDWIMDKVLGDIRLAPFVVADFTEHRNGVYLEAGFARGLGTPVIHTCRADQLAEAHFDTAQLNHVVWTTPQDLHMKLFHRILGSIGQGPHSAARRLSAV